MSDLSDAFSELLDAHEEACGDRFTATVGGAEVDAMVSEITFDEIVVAGGTGENGGFNLEVAVSDFDEEPAKFTPVTVNGLTLEVLRVDVVNGTTYRIIVGDPVKDE